MKIGELFIEIGTRLDNFNKGMSDVQKSMQNIGRKLSAVGRQLTMKVTLPIIALGVGAVKAFADFDKAMTESTAIMGKLSKSVKKDMADLAKTISTQTTFSAKELAAAYFYLASAGMDAEQSMKALGEVARFAQAGAFDLSTATDLLTDAQTALGLSSKDAAENQRNLIEVSDVLVKANTLANASVQEFAEALTSKAAASLVNVNKKMEEGVAVLAAYADKGIKGRLAGERLTMMLNGLFAATQQNKKAWDDVGISLFDAKGEMRHIGDIIGDLEVLLGNMTTEQKQATLAQLGFNVRTKDSILALMGSSEKIKQWTEDLKKAGGTTREVSDKQMESFSNKMTVIKNKLVKVAIEMGEKLIPTVERLAKEIEKAAKWFTNLSDGTKELIIKVLGLFAALGPVLMILGQILIVVPKLGKAFKFLAASPIVLLIAGLVVLGLATKKAAETFSESMKTYRKEMDETGKKMSWLARVAASSRKALQMPAMDFKANMRATRGFNEQMRKAKGVMTIVTGVSKVQSKGIKFLGKKWQELIAILPKAEKGFEGVSKEIKNVSKWIDEGTKEIIGYFRTIPGEAKNAYEIMKNSAVNMQERTLAATYQWGDSTIRVIRNMANVYEQSNVKMKDRTLSTLKDVKSAWEDVSDEIVAVWVRGLTDAVTESKNFAEAVKNIFKQMQKILLDVVFKNILKGLKELFKEGKISAKSFGTSVEAVFLTLAVTVTQKVLPAIAEAFGALFKAIQGGAKYTGDVISKEMLRATEGVAGKEGRTPIGEGLAKLLAILDRIPAALSVLVKNLSVSAKGFSGLGKIATLTLSAMVAKGRSLMESLKVLKKPLEALIKKYRDAGQQIPGFLKPVVAMMDKMKLHPRVFESLDAAMTILGSLSGAGVLTADTFNTLTNSATTFAKKILGVTGNLNQMIDGLKMTKEQSQMLLPIIAKFVSAAAAFGLPVPKWMKSVVTQKLGIDWDKFVKQVADPAKQTNSWLDKINVKAGRIWNILDNKLSNIEREVRDGLRPLKNLTFAASGVSETVSSPTMYMAGEKGRETVNISPVGQSGFQQNLSIESTPVNIYLDSQKVGAGLLEHLADFSKEGHMKIHASAVKDW